jgi:histidine triad (HIT) family protein
LSTVFTRIIRRELPADIIYEDEKALAFYDISPVAPIHFLVVPKREVVNVGSLTEDDIALMGHLLLVCKQVASQLGLDDYRVVTNSGAGAGQSVFHLHFHVIGGRSLSWPPG